jgi:hypothetical protein
LLITLSTQGLLTLAADAVHEQACFEPCYMTVVVEESDDEWTVWPLGKALRLCVVIKLLLILHYYWFVIMLLLV